MTKNDCLVLDERYLLLPEDNQTTIAGWEIPASSQKESQFAEVINVGTGLKDIEGPKKGDRVIFSKSAGQPIVLDGTTYKMIARNHIFAYFKKVQ